MAAMKYTHAMLLLTVFALSLVSAAKVGVELKDPQGKSVGSALMYESDGMVVQLDLHDFAPGRTRHPHPPELKVRYTRFQVGQPSFQP
jgi:hypothetical protein